MKNSIVFFDLDGTLIPKPSSERRFFKRLWQSGKLGWRQFFAAMFFFVRYSCRFGISVGRKNKAYLCGLNVKEIELLGHHWVNDFFDDILNPRMVSEVERCRQAGYWLVLLTGTPEFLAKPIAKRLAMDDYIATQCKSHDGYFTAVPPSQHPFGTSKLHLAKEYCRLTGAELDQSVAYGDSHQDYQLLKAVGSAIAVNPDRHMVALAQMNNWPVISID